MPRTTWFPPPAADRCPDCEAPVPERRCPQCGLDLDRPEASTLWWVDTELARLSGLRASLLFQLRRPAPTTASPPSAPAPAPALVGRQEWADWADSAVPPPAWADAGTGAGSARPVGSGVRVQNVLLGLGAFCLAIAAVVFLAVTWRRLDAVAQAAVLLGVTGGAGLLSSLAWRHGLRATAEATALVAFVLGLVDAQALRISHFADADTATYWSIALAVVALVGLGYGRLVPSRAAAAITLGLAQIPLLVTGVRLSPPAELAVLAGLVQAGVIVAAARALEGAGRGSTLVSAAGACGVLTGLVAAIGAAGMTMSVPTSDVSVPVSLTLVAAALAVAVALAWPEDETLPSAAIAMATALGVVAAIGVARPSVEGEALWLVAAIAGATVVTGATALGGRWSAPPAAIGAAAVAIGAAPAFEPVLAGLAGPLTALSAPWEGTGDDAVRALGDLDAWTGTSATAALLAVVTLALAGGARRLERAVVVAAATALGLVWIGVLPPVLDLRVDATVGAQLGLAAAATAVAVAWPVHRRPAWSVAIGAGGLALGWALGAEGTTTTALGVTFGLAVAVTVATAIGRRPVEAQVALGTAIVAAGGLAVTVPLALDRSGPAAWLCFVVTASAVSVVGWGLERWAGSGADPDRRPLARGLTAVADATTLAGHGLGLLVLAGLAEAEAAGTASPSDPLATTALAIALAVGAVSLGAHATRPTRRPLFLLALAEGLALVWIQLADAGVETLEAYSLPAAAALLVAGAWHGFRRPEAGSWSSLGPGLVVALAPSLVLALSDPGLTRTIGVALAATAVLLLGAGVRQQAPVAIGATALVVVGAEQLAPLVAQVPRWVVFAVIGTALLGVGATFEQRRRDLSVIRDRFGDLG